ncbi:ferric reductase like transmembrane component-domain-containing protein [Cokeromyces recurvatus]|uniref:ferric reductase like transmembrane component-domain-containing protein n=1 Tax=Cokeromyces recurvatus TaxID=90255 RepID=UPI00221EA20B|nr:ferric reductase like transmembrane component-domain-containing protein [Cokeromyces recurvatus]KAI7903252.1 ferric reductase like transmembrane component-domain-containing protein [Cokeromyces recurvatus]
MTYTVRATSTFFSNGNGYFFFFWCLFILYCIGYQLNRLRVYYIRKRRISSKGDNRVVTDLPGAKLLRRFNYVIRIPFVTEMIPIKHVIGVILFCIVNVIFIIFCPFQVNTHESFTVPPTVFINHTGAFIGMANWGFAFFLAQRNSILPKLSGLTFEELIPFHRIVSRIGFIEFIPHFVYRIMGGYRIRHVAKDALFYDLEQTSGTISMLGFIIMVVISLEYIRRNYFEVFYYCHVIFMIVGVVFGCIHEHTCFAFFIPAIVLWFADRVIRTYKSWVRKSRVVSIDSVMLESDKKEKGIVRILFENKYLRSFKPGQYVFSSMILNGRKIWEYANWHPFTISEVFRVSDSPDNEIEERVMGVATEKSEKISQDDTEKKKNYQMSYSKNLYSSSLKDHTLINTQELRHRTKLVPTYSSYDDDQNIKTFATFHIKTLGTKTRDLLTTATSKNQNIDVYIDGPFGPHHEYQDFPVLTLYATGIGITPALAIIKDMIDRRSRGIRTVVTESIYLTWAIPDINEIEPFMEIFTFWAKECASAIHPISLSVSIYVTRMKEGPNIVNHLHGFQLIYGQRPQISADMDKIAALHSNHRVWAHVCGSPAFTRTVINEAILHDFEAHNETFEF